MAEKKPATKTPRPSKRAPSHIASVAQSVALLPKMLETALAELPSGFKVKDFEMVGDTLRIFGSVEKEPRDQAAPAPAPSMPYTGGVVDAEIERKVSPLGAAIHSLDDRANEIACALHRLEDQAALILLPEPPAPAGNGEQTAPAPIEAPAVQQLQYLVGRLDRLVARVNLITSRIQA